MNKKLVSLILTAIMVLGSASAAFAASETTVTKGDGSEGIIVLDNLIKNGVPYGTVVEGTSGTAGTTVSGRLKDDNPRNYDQSTVTKTDVPPAQWLKKSSSALMLITITGMMY